MCGKVFNHAKEWLSSVWQYAEDEEDESEDTFVPYIDLRPGFEPTASSATAKAASTESVVVAESDGKEPDVPKQDDSAPPVTLDDAPSVGSDEPKAEVKSPTPPALPVKTIGTAQELADFVEAYKAQAAAQLARLTKQCEESKAKKSDTPVCKAAPQDPLVADEDFLTLPEIQGVPSSASFVPRTAQLTREDLLKAQLATPPPPPQPARSWIYDSQFAPTKPLTGDRAILFADDEGIEPAHAGGIGHWGSPWLPQQRDTYGNMRH